MRSKRIVRFKLPLFMRAVACYAAIGLVIWITPRESPVAAQPATVAVPIVATPASKVSFQQSQRISGNPNYIEITRLAISLPVVNGEYDQSSDTWTLNDDTAQFARITDLPNDESGNTFIYGHDRPAVFGALDNLQLGDEVKISTSNGYTFVYTFQNQQIINPDAISILAPSQTPILTLMTCEGVFSEARRIAIFNFKEVL